MKRILLGVALLAVSFSCSGTPPNGGTGGGSGTAGGTGTAGSGGTAGGATAGGSTAGGSGTAGGATAGGATAGGATAGGATAGGATAGGATAGGATAGGATAGGATAGGATAGGATAGGATAGGATAGGAGTAGGGTAGGATGVMCTTAMMAPVVNVTFGNCPATTVCSGSLPGTWFYTTGCSNNPFPEARQLCPAATFSNQSGSVRGCVQFNNTTVERHAIFTASATVNIPMSCTVGLPCTTIETLAQMYLPGATCTSAAAGGCDCTATRTTNINDTGGYTYNAGVLTVDGGVYDTCVNPSTTFTYNKPDGGIEEGQYTMTRQ